VNFRVKKSTGSHFSVCISVGVLEAMSLTSGINSILNDGMACPIGDQVLGLGLSLETQILDQLAITSGSVVSPWSSLAGLNATYATRITVNNYM